MSVASVKAIVNDVELDLSQTSESEWEVATAAPARSSYTQDEHYYGVTLIATDDDGNSTTIDATDTEFGDALQFYVREDVPPTIEYISPAEGEVISNPSPTFEFNVYDDDSGINLDLLYLKVNDITQTGELNITAIDGGYHVTYQYGGTLGDREYTWCVLVHDNDGNGTKGDYARFTVSTVAPTLTVTSPEEGAYFSTADVAISGTTDGERVTVSVNGGEEIMLDLTDGGFDSVITLAEGENVLVITATGASGLTTTVTRTVTVDIHAPVFKSVTIRPNPCDTGATYTISVEVTDDAA